MAPVGPSTARPGVTAPRVVCAGHLNWDVTLRVDRLPGPDEEARIRSRTGSSGGSAANVAVGLGGLDVNATLVGSVGDDRQGRLVGRALERRSVDLALTVVEGGRTALKYLLVDPDGEVAVLGMDGDNEAVDPTDVSPELLEGADLLHLTGQRPATAVHLAELAAERGIAVSFDPGRRVADRDYGGVLARVDILFLNEREAVALEETLDGTQDETIDGRLDETLVVTTYGTSGALLETPDGLYRHRAFGSDSVDSAGAGDAFAAGFLASYLDGTPPERALAVGNACGALAARERGPQVDLSWDAVESVLDRPG